MTTLRTLTCVSFAAAALLACEPVTPEPTPPPPVESADAAQLFAEQICGNLYACDCSSNHVFDSQAACVTSKRDNYQELIDLLLQDGTWNADCAGRMREAWVRWDCAGPYAASQDTFYNPFTCPIVKGSLGIDEACQRTVLGDLCAPGLECLGSKCVEMSLPIPIGAPCWSSWLNLPCADGGFCAYDYQVNDYVCVATPALGDSCAETGRCELSTTGLYCDNNVGICELAPGPGEPCTAQNTCAPGNYCDGGKDFTCHPQFEIGDGCSVSAVCPADAACRNNVCTPVDAAICDLAYSL
jgi:hypothetical protein